MAILKSFKKYGAIMLTVIIALSLAYVAPVTANADSEKIYLGGFVAGFDIDLRGATVIGISEVITETGVISPAKQAGILTDDVILSVNGYEINSSEDIEKSLADFSGDKVVVTVLRDGETFFKQLKPVKDLTGKYKIGVFVRDDLSGIGTVTFVKENGEFMALGHPVSDEDEIPLVITGGGLFNCTVFGIVKGERGKAGELKGMFLNDAPIGNIKGNFSVGLKGEINKNFDIKKLEEIQTAQAKIGEAHIVTTIDGITPQKFSVAIVKIDKTEKRNRNYVVKITDEKLLEVAGGIVQGMSGSPIIQKGKLVGAVTHVFLNDPTRGYGIDIQKMLSY